MARFLENAHQKVHRLSARRELSLLSVGLVLTLSAGSGMAGPEEDFYALEERLVEAQEEYMEIAAAIENKQSGKLVDGAQRPPDRRLGILKKMDALAVATAGKPDGLPVAVGVFIWSWNLDLDLDHLTARFQRVVEHYPDEPDVDEVLSAVGYAGIEVGDPDDWIKPLTQLSKLTKRKETKLGALSTMGLVQLAAGRLPDAKASFETILKSGLESDYVDSAKGYIFEIEHLQIGMVAPDFVAQTLDGKDVSLESLRGKAVLLNFWATW